MLSLAAPWWLCGLALLPVIRWLHRGGRHRRAVAVARVALWRAAEAKLPAAGERQPPDPAWRRRALLAALLFAALAGPQWPQSRPAVTLWVDDSLSMLTREVGGTRLALGLAQARAVLAEEAQGDIELRTLGDPWQRRDAAADVAALSTLAARTDRPAAAAPPAALLRKDRLHWLLTDGADAALLRWAGGRQPDRVIAVGSAVGSATRNVGLQRLAARRNPADAERIDVLAVLVNGGNAREVRELVLATSAGEPSRSTHTLEAGAAAVVQATMPAPGPALASLRAALQPGDALAEDDSLVLDLAPLRRYRVAVDASCPGPLRAAVGAHPALTIVAPRAGDADALLACGSGDAPSPLPTLRVRAERLPTVVSGAVSWSSALPEAQRLRLEAQALPLAATLAAGPADRVLLAVGDAPVVVSRAGATRRVETALDFTAASRTPGPEIPLLVNLMFEHMLAVPLLDPVAMTERPAAALNVVPAAPTLAAAPVERPAVALLLRDGTQPLLAAALLVLLWEIVALARQWWRLRPAQGALP